MALAVWLLLMVLATIGAALDRDAPVDSAVVWFLVVVLLTTPLQAAGEEYLFRGLLLQGLGATRLPTWVCCVVSAALFATAHGQFDPPLFADRFVLGVAFAWLTIRTGGLEAGIAIHTVKNLAGLIPAALLDDVSETLDPPGGVSWLPLIVDVVLLAILVPWVVAVCRSRVTGVDGGSRRRLPVGGIVSAVPRRRRPSVARSTARTRRAFWSRRTAPVSSPLGIRNGSRRSSRVPCINHGVWGNWQPDWFWSS